MSGQLIGMWLSGAATGWAIAYWLGKRHGHRDGWYRGYDARKYETHDGENYR